ncbi:MAG: carboxyl transferase domain-containing protein [Halieaceae bacterium]|nr:carboxyl transferase domain-containing protein [Halieaceae bacterium]
MSDDAATTAGGGAHSQLDELRERLARGSDAQRPEAMQRRAARGYLSARENLALLVDEGSFVEYGGLAVAAQRGRRELSELERDTPGDGVITGIARVNSEHVGAERARTAVIINDYTVLAGTQGFFHHAKIDRTLELAHRQALPVVMYTEGGGGRPGDTDVRTQIAGLNVSTFARWSSMATAQPRIAVNNGYCFAGNAALFGAADLRIATQASCIGMAGPAMIEGGGLGSFAPEEIGPASVQERNGLIDLLVADERAACTAARRLLWYFQGRAAAGASADQATLRDALPEDRRWSYDVRRIITTLFDRDSVTELRRVYGRSVITAFARLDGRAVGVLASDCRQLGGAVDSEAADKAARFLELCSRCGLPIVSLVDTPGFMVGPASETEGAVHRMSALFARSASLRVPLLAVFLRKAYGLGAMALVGGSFAVPDLAVSWPTGEFGGMGLEGAVRLGFRKELDAAEPGEAREALFNRYLAEMYARGRAIEAAAHLEIDAVIDPADTRKTLCLALSGAGAAD